MPNIVIKEAAQSGRSFGYEFVSNSKLYAPKSPQKQMIHANAIRSYIRQVCNRFIKISNFPKALYTKGKDKQIRKVKMFNKI